MYGIGMLSQSSSDDPYALMTDAELVTMAKGIAASALAIVPEWHGAGEKVAGLVQVSFGLEDTFRALGLQVASFFTEINDKVRAKTPEYMKVRNTLRQTAADEIEKIKDVLINRHHGTEVIRYNDPRYGCVDAVIVIGHPPQVKQCDVSHAPVSFDLSVPHDASLPQLQPYIEAAAAVAKRYEGSGVKGLGMVTWATAALVIAVLAVVALISYFVWDYMRGAQRAHEELQRKKDEVLDLIRSLEEQIAAIEFGALAQDRALTHVEKAKVAELQERLRILNKRTGEIDEAQDEMMEWFKQAKEIIKEIGWVAMIVGGTIVASILGLIVYQIVKD
jgi:HAMP domain-containing protein